MVNKIFSLKEGQNKVFPYTSISVGKGEKAVYIDEYESALSLSHKVQSSALIEINVEEDAELVYINIQKWPIGVYHFLNQSAKVLGNARFLSISIAFGGSLHIASLKTFLAGPGARSEMVGIIFGGGSQYFDFHTLQEHNAYGGLSDQLFKTVVSGHSQANFMGLIRVCKNAQKTDAYQANRNLLLSADARVGSIPKLEIEADDVRCTHGVSIGTLDEEQIFYLTSRGIKDKDAERLIVEGFFEQILERVPAEELRSDLRDELSRKTQSHFGSA